MTMFRRLRQDHPQRHGRATGQSLVEFALVFPLFMLLMLFIIEFAFVFSALLGVNYASRNAALAPPKPATTRWRDCVILQQVEDSIGAPGNKASIQTVTIYRTDQSGSDAAGDPDVHPRRHDDLHQGNDHAVGSVLVADRHYTYDQRCNFLNGCPILGRTQIDTIGVEITYHHTWVTPIRNFGLAGTGVTLTQSNAMRMEPIL